MISASRVIIFSLSIQVKALTMIEGTEELAYPDASVFISHCMDIWTLRDTRCFNEMLGHNKRNWFP